MKSLLKFGSVLLVFGCVFSIILTAVIRGHAVPPDATPKMQTTPSDSAMVASSAVSNQANPKPIAAENNEK
ncbi:hypothetical protein [Undibacterium fentianense]|uniref:Uncharacterized protein n=1 Tax=Undibacterium fentianense TaxID=2828728 RepID=A0A941E3Q8_9BURK|nr:hypothetical protein [Undibacterium fentianense]MBR7801790.1 hypothetical protein [Undibacterium fentianense]